MVGLRLLHLCCLLCIRVVLPLAPPGVTGPLRELAYTMLQFAIVALHSYSLCITTFRSAPKSHTRSA